MPLPRHLLIMYGPSLRGSIFSLFVCCWAVFSSNSLVLTSISFCKCFLLYASFCCFCALVMFAWAFWNAWLLDSNSAPKSPRRCCLPHHPLLKNVAGSQHQLAASFTAEIAYSMVTASWMPAVTPCTPSGLWQTYRPSWAYLHQQSLPDIVIRFG